MVLECVGQGVPPASHFHQFVVRATGRQPRWCLWQRHWQIRKCSCGPGTKSLKLTCTTRELGVSKLPVMPVRGGKSQELCLSCACTLRKARAKEAGGVRI